MTIKALFDTSKTQAGRRLSKYTYPWEVLPHIGEIAEAIGKRLPQDEYNHLGKNIWIHKSVNVPPTVALRGPAVIGPKTEIRNGAFIRGNVIAGEGVVIGDHTTIYAGAKIYYGCVIGSGCTIHAGTVIGADGFGFAPNGDNYNKVPQIGNVVVEDNVEIGANACIDRATMGSTRIKKGVKLDNLVQIAHNVVVGENTVMAAQCGIAGTTKVGAHCMFGGQVGIAGHLRIEDKTMLAAQSGVTNDIPEGSVFMGAPAFDVSKYRKCYVLFRKLPELYGQLRDLEKEIQTLKSKQ